MSLEDFVDKRTKQAEVFNSILNSHIPPDVLNWEEHESGWTFQLGKELTIRIVRDREHMSVVATSNHINRKMLDTIRAELRSRLRHGYDPTSHLTSLAVVLLQLAEDGAAFLQFWREAVPTKRSNERTWTWTGPNPLLLPRKGGNPLLWRRKKEMPEQKGWDASGVTDWKSTVLNSPFGVDLNTIKDTATHLLGKSIRDICSDIPDWLRILHVEPVFRTDLVERFVLCRQQMLKQLSDLSYSQLRLCVSHKAIGIGSSQDNIMDLAEELATPRVTFHGSDRSNISSVVRYGFIKPGDAIGSTGKSVSLHAGSTYGMGIYSSPDPIFATHYAGGYCGDSVAQYETSRPRDMPGMRLFVCATLMGRAVEVTRSAIRGTTEISNKSANSHVSPDGLQYIVFDAAQIIPCYVLHLDFGAEQAQAEFDEIARNATRYFERRKQEARASKTTLERQPSCPGEVQAKKEALKAAAKKWFPCGYGPAQGESFVVEEIGYVSDDEEDYGEYQYLRNEQEDEIRQVGLDADVSWFDEYQTVRKSKKELELK